MATTGEGKRCHFSWELLPGTIPTPKIRVGRINQWVPNHHFPAVHGAISIHQVILDKTAHIEWAVSWLSSWLIKQPGARKARETNTSSHFITISFEVVPPFRNVCPSPLQPYAQWVEQFQTLYWLTGVYSLPGTKQYSSSRQMFLSSEQNNATHTLIRLHKRWQMPLSWKPLLTDFQAWAIYLKSYPGVCLWHDPQSRLFTVRQDIIEFHPRFFFFNFKFYFIFKLTRRISFFKLTGDIIPGKEYISNIWAILQ